MEIRIKEVKQIHYPTIALKKRSHKIRPVSFVLLFLQQTKTHYSCELHFAKTIEVFYVIPFPKVRDWSNEKDRNQLAICNENQRVHSFIKDFL